VGPYSNVIGQEGLDAVLVGAAFDQELSILFLHDGVFQVKDGQASGSSGIKQYTKTFGALEDFGVEKLFVHENSMAARGLTTSQLLIEATVLDNDDVAKLISNQDQVLVF
jgi:tRNA 2-thiouridine synthesizing protein C